jgi:hypothetical protein
LVIGLKTLQRYGKKFICASIGHFFSKKTQYFAFFVRKICVCQKKAVLLQPLLIESIYFAREKWLFAAAFD